MAVPYLAGGESPDAAKLNVLWDAFDSKLGAILQFKSPIVAINARTVNGFPGELLGKCFFFTDGALPSKFAWRCPGAKVNSGTAGIDPVTGLPVSNISNIIIHRYDHQMFLNALQNISGLVFDEARSIVEVDDLAAGNYSSGLAPATNVSVFDHSLAVAKYRRPADGKLFYVKERSVAHPEKFYRYALAEIILEGVTELNIPDTWDKYVCFRIHNLNYGAATVTFGSGAGAFTVNLAALECAPVRRDRSVSDGVATFTNYRSVQAYEGRRYFFDFERGDLRHYFMFHASWQGGLVNNNAMSRSQDTPANGMVANNLCNPAILYDWIRTFKYDRANDVDGEGKYAWFHPDVHEVTSVAATYAALLGNPESGATNLGDLVWHKGKVLVVKFHKTETMAEAPTLPRVEYFEIDFNGFGTVAADWAPRGINVTEDANGLLQFKASTAGDFANWDFMLIPYGTNLFRQANEGYRTVVDLSGGRVATLDPHWFDQQVEPVAMNQVAPQVLVRRAATGTLNRKFWTYAEGFYDSNQQPLITQVDGDPSSLLADIQPPIAGRTTLWDPQRRTVAELLQLNFFGDKNQASQNTDYTSYAEARLALTPFGLQLLFVEQVPADLFAYAGNDPGANPARFGEGWELDDGKDEEGAVVRPAYFRRKQIIRLRGHGFPWMEEGRAASLFFSARDGRRLMEREKFLDVVAGTAGADYTAQYPLSKESGVKVMRRVKLAHLTNATQSGRFWEGVLDDSLNLVWERYQAGDVAFRIWVAGARQLLLSNQAGRGKAAAYSLLREHYNGMAMAVNQLKEGKQLDFRALRFIATWQGQSYVIGIRPLVDVNVWQGRSALPVPYEAFDYHFGAPTEDIQRTFALYQQAGIAIRTLPQVPGWNEALAARNVDRKISVAWAAAVSGSAQAESGPLRGWYISNVDLSLTPTVSYQDSARAAGTAFFYNGNNFASLQTVYAGFEWVSFADVYAWLSGFGLPIVYDECFMPLELKVVRSSRTQHEGNFHAPQHTFTGPTAHDTANGRVFVAGGVNNLDKTHTFTSEFFHRDVELLAFAPVATSAAAKALAAQGKLWKCPIAGFTTKQVRYWKNARPLRYVLQGVPDFTTSGGSFVNAAEIRFMDNPLVQFSHDETYRVAESGSTNSAWNISKQGPYVHLEWGPGVEATDEEQEDHNLWLAMNFRGLFPIAFRAGGGNDFTAKPNFLMAHQDFWAAEKDHFNARVEYSWERIFNNGGELTLRTFFPPATSLGKTADLNFSRYIAVDDDVHPWRWARNLQLAQRRLAPQIELGVNVLPIAASQGSDDYGVVYYVNFVKRYSTAAI